jgi:enoyl-CoA hydratase/carnithine racemase
MANWIVDREDAVVVLTVNRPEVLNAMSLAMFEELVPILDELDSDSDVRVVLVRGSGHRAFVAGADIGEFEEEFASPAKAMAYDRGVEEGAARLEDMQKPTVAMIHGYALGTGVFFAATCDLRIASDKAQFSVPVGRYGIMPSPPDLYRLIRLVGYGNVLDMILTGRRYNAYDAQSMGLVNMVVPSEHLEEVALSVARQIAEKAPLSLLAVRDLSRKLAGAADPPTIETGETWYHKLYTSEDAREGARAYQEKRAPRFIGQ